MPKCSCSLARSQPNTLTQAHLAIQRLRVLRVNDDRPQALQAYPSAPVLQHHPLLPPRLLPPARAALRGPIMCMRRAKALLLPEGVVAPLNAPIWCLGYQLVADAAARVEELPVAGGVVRKAVLFPGGKLEGAGAGGAEGAVTGGALEAGCVPLAPLGAEDGVSQV